MEGGATGARWPGLVRAVVPAALGLVVAGSLVGIILAAREAGSGGQAPPTPGPMVMPRTAGFAVLTVERVEGDRLVVAGGPTTTLVVPAGTPAWRIEPVTVEEVRPGMRIAVVGVPNEVRNATIRLIVVAEAGEADGDGTLAGPFGGHETLGETMAQPLIRGVVTEVRDGQLTVETSSGTATVWTDEGAPLAAARRAHAGGVRPGDRLAVLLDAAGNPDAARGVLLMAGE